MSPSPYSSVDSSDDPPALVAQLEATAVGLGAMKRYVAYRLAQEVPDPLVLDLGCGAGSDLELLAREGLVPVGLDPSAVMLASARQRETGRSLVLGAGDRLPLRDESIGGCRIERVLMHVEDPSAVIGEVARVLRRRGVLAVFEPDWESLRFESDTPGAETVMGRLSPCRWPGIGSRLVELVEAAGFAVLDEVSEVSRGENLDGIPLDIAGRVARRIAEGSVDADIGDAWLEEQRERDRTGRLRARWTKRLVVARRRS